jgi:hypothetical protein
MVLFGGNGYDDTWTYQTRPEDRPGVLLSFDFSKAHVATASVTGLEVVGLFGADAHGLSGQTLPGAEILAWDAWGGRWTALADSDAPAEVPQTLTTSVAGGDRARRLIAGDGLIRVLVAPRGGLGPNDTPPTLALDYVEVTVHSKALP